MRREGSGIPAYSKGFLIYNPNAGAFLGTRASSVDEIVELLRDHGHHVEAFATNKGGDAVDLARLAVREGADLILAAGGDGTLNEVVNGMALSKVPLAFLPVGTANVYAQEIGFRSNYRKVIRELSQLAPYRTGLGLLTPSKAPSRYFLLMAGFGFDASLVQRVEPEWKRRFGKVSYYIAGISSLLLPIDPLIAKLGDEQILNSFTLVSRARNYGGDLSIAPTAHLLREGFEVVHFEGLKAVDYLAYVGAVVSNRVQGFPGVRVYATRELHAEPVDGRSVYVQVDGELAGELPASVRYIPDAITLLLPERYAARVQI